MVKKEEEQEHCIDLAQKRSPVFDIVSHPRLNIMYDVTKESVINKYFVLWREG